MDSIMKRRICVFFIALCSIFTQTRCIAFGSSEMIEDDKSLLELTERYYDAIMEEDEETLETIVAPWNDEVKEETISLNDKFRRIDNIKTYPIDGPVDDSWLVYVCCESWVDGVEIGIPTLFNPLVVIATDSNDLRISSDRKQYADFINEANSSESVRTLINDINKQYEEVRASNQNDASEGGFLVWIPTNGGEKYHSYAGCSNMVNPIQVTEGEAIKHNYSRCEKCW